MIIKPKDLYIKPYDKFVKITTICTEGEKETNDYLEKRKQKESSIVEGVISAQNNFIVYLADIRDLGV